MDLLKTIGKLIRTIIEAVFLFGWIVIIASSILVPIAAVIWGIIWLCAK